ncbi:MAG TPA: hypothetical protein VLD67_13010 [Vicinamibacterales bacterium]|nr:hypothetical protein [Vicinamibacterales bacterium]
MTTPTDHELQQWIDVWHADTGETAAPEAIRAHVRRRSILLRVWIATEIVLCLFLLGFVVHRAVTHPDLLEKLAMALLALIAASAGALSWWNWRGALRAAAETTAAFLALSAERSRRLRRAISIGWGILAAEILVFVPWVWYRLYGGLQPPSAAAERFGWGLLAGMTVLAVLFLAGLHAWARREARLLDELRREVEGE